MYALIEKESLVRELMEGVWNAGYIKSAVGSGDSGEIDSPIGTLRFTGDANLVKCYRNGKMEIADLPSRVADHLNWIVFDEAGIEWLGGSVPNYIALRGPVVEEDEDLLEYTRVSMHQSDWGAAIEYLRDSALKFRAAGMKKLGDRFMQQARRLAKRHGLKMPTANEPDLADLSGPVVEDVLAEGAANKRMVLKKIKALAHKAATLRLKGTINKAMQLDRQIDALVDQAERAGFGDDAMQAEEDGREKASDDFHEDEDYRGDELVEAKPSGADLRNGVVVGVDKMTGAKFIRVKDKVWYFGGPGSGAVVNEGSWELFQKKVKAGRYAKRIDFTLGGTAPSAAELNRGSELAENPMTGDRYVQVGDVVWRVPVKGKPSRVGSTAEFLKLCRAGRIKALDMRYEVASLGRTLSYNSSAEIRKALIKAVKTANPHGAAFELMFGKRKDIAPRDLMGPLDQAKTAGKSVGIHPSEVEQFQWVDRIFGSFFRTLKEDEDYRDDELVEAKPVGKVQQAVVKLLQGSDFMELTDIARQLPPTIHFARIQNAVQALIDKGILQQKREVAKSIMVKLAEGVLDEAKGEELTEGRAKTAKKDIRLKNGDVIPNGTKVLSVKFDRADPRRVMLYLDYEGSKNYRVDPFKTAAMYLPFLFSGFSPAPKARTMEKWMDDGVAKTVTGKRVAPDGTGPDGSPSWLLALGMI